MKRSWPAFARLGLIAAGVAGAWFLFPGLRRVEFQLRVRDAHEACARQVSLRMGQEGRVDYALNMAVDGAALPPWTISLSPGEYAYDGEIACGSGEVVSLGRRKISVESDGAMTLELKRYCRCSPSGT